MYIAAGELDHWQSALRDATTELYTAMSEATSSFGRMTIDLLYGNIEHGQSTITRFMLVPSEHDNWRGDPPLAPGSTASSVSRRTPHVDANGGRGAPPGQDEHRAGPEAHCRFHENAELSRPFGEPATLLLPDEAVRASD